MPPQMGTQKSFLPWSPPFFFASFQGPAFPLGQTGETISSLVSEAGRTHAYTYPSRATVEPSARMPQRKTTASLLMLITSHCHPRMCYFGKGPLPNRDKNRKSTGMKRALIDGPQENIKGPTEIRNQAYEEMPICALLWFFSKMFQHLRCWIEKAVGSVGLKKKKKPVKMMCSS